MGDPEKRKLESEEEDRGGKKSQRLSSNEEKASTSAVPPSKDVKEVITLDDDDVMIVEDSKMDEEALVPEKPTDRQLYAFLIQLGISLKLKNRSVCTSILLMHQILKKEAVIKNICNYTLATACMMVGLKYEEERGFRVRRVTHAAHSIISSRAVMEGSDEIGDMATGVGRLEFLVLREVAFKLDFNHPHTHLALITQSLSAWMDEDFKEKPVASTAATILRDCYIDPSFVLDHKPKSIAIAVLSLTLKGFGLEVPVAHKDWHEAFSSALSARRLKSLEKKIMEKVYKVEIADDY